MRGCDGSRRCLRSRNDRMGASAIHPPIIAVDGLDTIVFESVDAAERFYCRLEDAETDQIFDASGRRLRAMPAERTAVRFTATEYSDPLALRGALMAFLRAVGEPIGDDATLDWLVQRGVERSSV